VVWTVAPGHHEAGQIRETIITIVNRGTVACGEIGQRFVHRESGIEGVTEELAQIFFRAAPSLRSVMNRWQALAHEARGALFQEVRGMMDGVEEGELSPFSTLFVPAARDLGW
jgi:hypothetical protein